MIIFLLKVSPEQGKRRELLGILHGLIGPTSIQPGCLGCEVYEGSGDDQTVLYLEQWESLGIVERHVQSALYVRLLAAMEMSTTKPEISFHETSRKWGMELIKSLRKESVKEKGLRESRKPFFQP